MGTNITLDRLLEEKNKILDEMLRDMKNWDENIEKGIELMELNQKRLEDIKIINKKLYKKKGEFFDQEGYYRRITDLVFEIRKMSAKMEEGKAKIIEEKKELDKKDASINNYMARSKDSIFVDKNI